MEEDLSSTSNVPINKSSTSPEAEPASDEPAQTTDTQIVNQDIKKGVSTQASDGLDVSSLPKIQAADETHQNTTLDENKGGNPSTPELDATTDELDDAVTPQVLDSVSNSPPEVQPTTTCNLGNSSPLEVQHVTKTLTTQTPESNATRDIGISSPTEVKPTNSHELSTDPKANKHGLEIQPIPETPIAPHATNNTITSSNVAPTVPDPEQERKQLVNLIEQELDFVKITCPKLGKHQAHIKNESDEVSRKFTKLKDEPCELKELKDMKKAVTKLKLQIPAKYRTYDENKEDKDRQFDARNVISSKLQKQMPQFHSKLFHETPFCRTIQQRYDSLRSELKLCLLCFSVFPENEIISRRLMVYLWIGEGLIPPANYVEGEETVEEYGNKLFKELMDMDFFEPISKRYGCNVSICKMHPMVRASLVMIADTVRFFDFDEYGNPKDFGKFDEIESPEDLPVIYPLGDPREFFDFYDENRHSTSEKIEFTDSKGNPIQFAALPQDPALHQDPALPQDPALHQDPNPPLVDCFEKPIDKTRKYYFYKKKKITTKSFKVCLMGSGLSKGVEWEKLHMLFNVKDDILEFKPEWFLRMKNVSVVFLGRWQSSAAHHIEVDEFKFEESLEHMNHVRFFSLQGVSRISELPKSISNLESLLILDLRACHNLEVIPRTISSLKYLTHLDMSDCYLLEHMPKEISSLKSLQVLKGFVVVESLERHPCTLHDLKKLPNLRKLSMYTHMEDFPQESHLDALQKFEALRKLSILWGSHEKSKTDKADSKTKKVDQDATKKHSTDKDAKNKDSPNKTKDKPVSRVIKQILRKPWVKGSMRRMNAFNNATLGSRLEKLDLKCYPVSVTPNWLTPGSLKGLKKLYIRGGNFSDLGQYQDILDWDDSSIPPIDTWNVEVLRLKYLDEIKMDWRELQRLFPKMASLEKVKCPGLTLFPCNEQGFWKNKKTKMTT